MRALHRKLLRDLVRQRGAVLTIAVVVACGIAAFVGSWSSHATLREARDRYYEDARFAQLFAQVRRAPLSLMTPLRELPGVLAAEAGISGPVQLPWPGEGSLSGQAFALPSQGIAAVNRLQLLAGRWPAADDRDGVLVHRAFAQARGLQPGTSLTVVLNGRLRQLTVRGIVLSPEHVVAIAQVGLADETRFALLWLPRPVMEAAFDLRGSFNTLAVATRRGADLAALRAAVAARLEPYGNEGVLTRAEQPSAQLLDREIREQRIYGVVFPLLLLGVALFLLQVILSRHIATERLQIAALKALGYEAGAITLHYLAFVWLIIALGALLGGAVGAWLADLLSGLYAHYFHFPRQPTVIAWEALLACWGLASVAATAVVAGSLRSVLQLNAATALRPSVPALPHQGARPRPAGLWHATARQQMVLRGLRQQPWRTALTTLGIGCGSALLVAGAWWGDAFDELLRVEFSLRERADLLVALDRPRPATVLHEVSQLPGVLQAEGSLDLPVELQHGNQRLQLTLMGLDEPSRLHPVLDTRQNPLALLPERLVLAAPAAQALGLRPGDRVWVDPWRGGRPGRWLTVTALSGNLTGRVAYAPRSLVGALQGEQGYSTLRLRVAADQRAAVLAALGQRPRVATAGDKQRLVDAFRRSTADVLLTFTSILTAFATAVAIGIVYNSARVALAERSWELATLRVLGCTRAEVSALLLWPLGLQVLLALPLGALLGEGLAALLVHWIAGDDLQFPRVILPWVHVYAAGITVAAAAASAAVVRRHIDHLDLVGVLKTRD